MIGFTGVWALAMDTLSQVLVATAIAVVIGVVLGVLAAESNRFSKAMRPVNDLLQTLPQLVYIIPFIYLMPVSIVPGIVAGVLYAFPVTLRLVERGVRDVAPTSVEAANAFGASRRQVLMKVKLPLAGDAVMLGINQAIIMVLAVVVIAGLVGSGGLGYEVAQGLVRGAVRAGRDRLGRDPRSRNRSRPGHAGNAPSAEGGHCMKGSTETHNEREGRMSVRGGRLGRIALVGLTLVGVAALAVSASAFGKGAAASCGTVIINEQSWSGSTANTYVAKYVLEKRLGCKVKLTQVTEGPPYFQAMRDGKVDVALEDWDNTTTKTGSALPQGRVGPHRRLERDHRRASAGTSPVTCSSSTRRSRRGRGSRARRPCSSRPSRARRGCSSAAIPPTSKRTGR